MSGFGVKPRFKRAAIAVGVVLLMTMVLPFAGFAETADSRLVAHYTFEGDFKDASGNGNDGTAVGDVTFVDDGVMGKSASFNGGFVSVNSSPKLNLGSNFTVAIWLMVDPVMSDSGNKNGPFISKLDDKGNYNNYNIYTRGTFGVRFDGRFSSPGRAEKPVITENSEDIKKKMKKYQNAISRFRTGFNAVHYEKITDGKGKVRLTKRETEILRLIVEGFSGEEISKRLYVTPINVRVITSKIYAKLGVNS